MKTIKQNEENKVTLGVVTEMLGKMKICLISYDAFNITLKIPTSQFKLSEITKIVKTGKQIMKGAKK